MLFVSGGLMGSSSEASRVAACCFSQFENRFLEAARNAAGVGAASPASSSVCSLVIEYDSDEEQEERGELDPQLKEEMEERLANPVFTVAKVPGPRPSLTTESPSPSDMSWDLP